MSPATLALFKQLLDNVTLNVGAPDFEEAAQQVLTARRELAEAITQTDRSGPWPS